VRAKEEGGGRREETEPIRKQWVGRKRFLCNVIEKSAYSAHERQGMCRMDCLLHWRDEA